MGCLADSRPKLDTDPLPLTADCLSQVGHLRAHDIVDSLTRAIYVFAHRFSDFFSRKRVDQLFAAIARDSVAA